MLRIAVPNKGALSDDALALIKEAGYRCRRTDRELIVCDDENEVEFLFLRPRDIAVYVSRGILDIGITGRDLALDSESEVVELLALGFGRSTFRYAVPVGSDLIPDRLDGCRIATSYANLVQADLRKRGVSASVVHLDGAVEISVRLGVADAIADVVESGRTLQQADLKTVGDPILYSEAVVVARNRSKADDLSVRRFLSRLQGILMAREHVMVEYDIPRSLLEAACAITPGIESPTVAPLNDPRWAAVKAMARRRDINRMMDELEELGAKGILITDIRTCRI